MKLFRQKERNNWLEVMNRVNIKLKDTNINLFSSFLSSKKENSADQLRRPEKNYGLNISKKLNNKYFGNYNLNLLYN